LPMQSAAKASEYCKTQGMRLPTATEMIGITGANHDSCVFPCSWFAWTSSSDSGKMLVVQDSGAMAEDVPSDNHDVLCVR
jgi:flavin reductase (DIM6/NTAB) family NADH-FMN oxidoreductase RutF